MTHVATLIAPDGTLAANAPELVLRMLPDAGEPQWLSPGTAADIPFTADRTIDQRETARAIREELAAPIDVVVQAVAGRRRKLFVADMDSTMIGQECLDELADYAGLKPKIAAITERAMRGEIAFEPALRERVALLKGMPARTVEDVLASRIVPTAGGRALVATMRKHGAWTCLVSGGFTLFTGPVAMMLGFDQNVANRLLLDGDRLSGQVAEPIFGRDGKRKTLVELCAQHGFSLADSLAVGDGANDIDMIVTAGQGIAFHGKPAVVQAAPAHIDHCDLTAVLYAQGYCKDEFASA